MPVIPHKDVSIIRGSNHWTGTLAIQNVRPRGVVTRDNVLNVALDFFGFPFEEGANNFDTEGRGYPRVADKRCST